MVNKRKHGDLRSLRVIVDTECIEKGFLFADLDSYRLHNIDNHNDDPIFDPILAFFIVDRGTFEININNEWHRCSASVNNLVHIEPRSYVFGISVSENFHGYLLAYSKQFVDDNFQFIDHMPPPNLGDNTGNGIYSTNSKERGVLIECCERIEYKFEKEEGLYKKSMITLAALDFFLEVMSTILSRDEVHKTENKRSRKQEIFKDFSLLLLDYCLVHHDVAFYANKLCITRGYLSKTVKEVSGLSASQIINDSLVSEAYTLLRSTNKTIERISEDLHFADRPTFGKFFKTNTGKTPAQYRKYISGG